MSAMERSVVRRSSFAWRIRRDHDLVKELWDGQKERADFVTVVLWTQCPDLQKEIYFGGSGGHETVSS